MRTKPAQVGPLPAFNALTASASIIFPRRAMAPRYDQWQDQAWAFYDCADDQTEILTIDGWRTHDQLDTGTLVLTLDHDTGTSGWEPILDVHRYEVRDEPMLSMQMRHHSSLTTRNHRWPVLRQTYAQQRPTQRLGTVRTGRIRAWTTAGELAAEDQIITAAPNRDVPAEAKYADAFVELVAWFWTEGTIRADRTRPCVTIAQSQTVNPSYVARIRAALTALFGPRSDGTWPGRTAGPPRWREWRNPSSGCILFTLSVAAAASLLDVAPRKIVAPEFIRSLTAAQLLLFLEVSMLADGRIQSGMIGQKDPERLAGYELACILAGRTPHLTYCESARMWRLHDLPRTTATPRRRHREIVRYTGTVWCPTTGSGTWFARRNGTVYVTGNSIGELAYGVGWLANALSRVRLLAAEVVDGGDEPTPIGEGPAAELIARLAGGTGGQSALVQAMTTHLCVPGEFWLLGEAGDPLAGPAGTAMFSGAEAWTVRSADELRLSPRTSGAQGAYQVREGDKATAWRPLGPDSLVVRCWDPHPRWAWKADSPTRHALGALVELDMVNKRILATTMSRLASNGILLYDRMRLSVPTSTSPGEADVDPFAALLVDIATRGIADPASPEACIPIPIGYQIEDLTGVDPSMLMQVVRMDNAVTQELLAQRDSAVKRLAIVMDLPAETLLGLGSSNHWSAWAIEESAIKIHVSPLAETICHCLTTGYLTPALAAAGAPETGPNGGRVIVWYDPSEITARPDRSANVVEGYDRLEVSGTALRRELGIDEADAPDPAELAAMVVKRAVTVPALAASAITALGGPKLVADIAGAGGAPPAAPPKGDQIQPGAPARPPTGAPPAARTPAGPPVRNGAAASNSHRS